MEINSVDLPSKVVIKVATEPKYQNFNLKNSIAQANVTMSLKQCHQVKCLIGQLRSPERKNF